LIYLSQLGKFYFFVIGLSVTNTVLLQRHRIRSVACYSPRKCFLLPNNKMLQYSHPPSSVLPDYVITHLGPFPQTHYINQEHKFVRKMLNYRDQELTLEHFWKFGSKRPLDKLRVLSSRSRRGMRNLDSIEVIIDTIRTSGEQAAKYRQVVTSIFDYYMEILNDEALFSPDFSV